MECQKHCLTAIIGDQRADSRDGTGISRAKSALVKVYNTRDEAPGLLLIGPVPKWHKNGAEYALFADAFRPTVMELVR